MTPGSYDAFLADEADYYNRPDDYDTLETDEQDIFIDDEPDDCDRFWSP